MVRVLIFVLVLGVISCNGKTSGVGESQLSEELLEVENIRKDMNIRSFPDSLVFECSQTIPIVLECCYMNSPLQCGSGQIYYLIDKQIDYDRVYTDSSYEYLYTESDDTIFLTKPIKGNHYISGIFEWNRGGWTIVKYFKKEIIII